MFRTIRKELAYALVLLLLAGGLIHLCSTALRPPRVTYGATWDSFLAEPKHSLDYLYLGSSYAYCDVNPAYIYQESGLTGYVLAGPEQTLSTTYWYLKEALKTQSPTTVFIEATGLNFNAYEGYSQINVGYMPPSLNKLGAIFNAAEEDLWTGLLFDLYFYHNQWKTLTPSALAQALAPKTADQLKGFTAVDGVFDEIANGPFVNAPKEDAIYQDNLADLQAILELCQRKNIQAVVIHHPTYSLFPPDYYETVAQDILAMHTGADYYNWSQEIDSVGIVPTQHFYDPGHLNQAGAQIFSTYLGNYMQDTLGLIPQPQSPEITAAWQDTLSFWRTNHNRTRPESTEVHRVDFLSSTL